MKDHPFELQLSVSSEELSATLFAFENIAWLDFWLNPRRLRGSDFLMRWSQGVWSENRLVEAVDQTADFHALQVLLAFMEALGIYKAVCLGNLIGYVGRLAR